MSQRDARTTIGTVAKWLLWFVYAWVVVNLVLLFLAFMLQLLGANPEAEFAQWVYRSVDRVMAPFRGLFSEVEVTGESTLDTSMLFAMIIYGLVALFLHAVINWLTDRLDRRRRELETSAPAAAQTGVTRTPPPTR